MKIANWPNTLTRFTSALPGAVACATVSLTLGIASQAALAAPPAYTITDLGTLPGYAAGTYAAPAAINASGQIVGSVDDSVGNPRAFLWDNGAMTNLNDLYGSIDSEAYGMNDFGHVVGQVYVDMGGGGRYRPYLWADGSLTDLGNLGGPNGNAQAINSAGQIVGSSQISMEPGNMDMHAFSWQEGVMADLGTLGGANSFALDINESGVVVGNADHALGTDPFIWSDGVMTSLGNSGDPYLYLGSATAINDSEQVVGVEINFMYEVHAYIWNNGEMSELPGLGIPYASPSDINDSGLVVGFAYTPDAESRAVLWDDGVPIDLNSLLDGGDDWALQSASAINNAGQIVGTGLFDGETHGFLITPIPEPTTLSLLALGGLALLRRRR